MPKYETEIQDLKMTKSFDVSNISEEILETLILYADLTKR
jgi:hypothetical protein